MLNYIRKIELSHAECKDYLKNKHYDKARTEFFFAAAASKEDIFLKCAVILNQYVYLNLFI